MTNPVAHPGGTAWATVNVAVLAGPHATVAHAGSDELVGYGDAKRNVGEQQNLDVGSDLAIGRALIYLGQKFIARGLDRLPPDPEPEPERVRRGGFAIGDRVRVPSWGGLAGGNPGTVVAFSPDDGEVVEVLVDDYTFSSGCSVVVPGAGSTHFEYLVRAW